MTRSYLEKEVNMGCDVLSIHDLIINGDENQINQSIENGVGIDGFDQLHWTPLHWAIRLGKIKIVQLLLKKKVNVEAKTLGGLTPLHIAVLLQDTEMVKILLHHGTDVNAKNDKDQTPLSALLEEKEVKLEPSKVSYILQLLLENNAQHEPEQILDYATSNSLTEFSKYYVNKYSGGNCEETNVQMMFWVVSKGREEMLQTMLTNGSNPDVKCQKQRTPLLWAILKDREDMVKCLLTNGANVNLELSEISKINPINFAVKKGSLRIARLLLQNGAIVNNELYFLPIFIAILNRSRDALELLLEYGADTNILDNHTSQTPLSKALQIKEWDIAKTLIAHGAITKPEFISIAINNRCDNADLLSILIANGGDVNSKSTTDLKTPLHLASEYGLSNAAKILLEHGADQNIKDAGSKTPMEYALLHDQFKVYKVIISFVNLQNDLSFLINL